MKDNAAAEALSNLSQSTFGHPMSQIPMHTFQVHPGLSEPGPSTHPNGPPNLGLSMSSGPNGSASTIRSGEGEDSTQPTDGQGLAGDSSTQSASGASPDDKPAKGSGGRRSGRSATMTNDEWARQRKDNHVSASGAFYLQHRSDPFCRKK